MAIEFPEFKDGHLCWIAMCAQLLPADKELKAWMKTQNEKLSAFKAHGGNAHIRLRLGGNSESHFHIDVTGPGTIFWDMPKKAGDQMQEIENAIEKLFGKTVEANIEAGFKAAFEELPDSGIVRSMFFEKKVGNVAIKSNGASMSIEGAPIQKITWFVPDENHIHVTMEAVAVKKPVSDDYLASAINMMEEAFNIFVLGKASNDSK